MAPSRVELIFVDRVPSAAFFIGSRRPFDGDPTAGSNGSHWVHPYDPRICGSCSLGYTLKGWWYGGEGPSFTPTARF